jgi:hypothetical protein
MEVEEGQERPDKCRDIEQLVELVVEVGVRRGRRGSNSDGNGIFLEARSRNGTPILIVVRCIAGWDSL